MSDTGYGMDLAIKEKIFDPYFTTKEKGVGTGLGLAVVHGIVKRCKGAIFVNSEPWKETAFDVYFPILEMEAVEKPMPREGLPGGQEHVLFVDNEETLVSIGQQMLERLGYKVEVKRDPIEALEVFRAKPNAFDLVVTDQTLPHMTSEQLAKELMNIRSDIPTHHSLYWL